MLRGWIGVLERQDPRRLIAGAAVLLALLVAAGTLIPRNAPDDETGVAGTVIEREAASEADLAEEDADVPASAPRSVRDSGDRTVATAEEPTRSGGLVDAPETEDPGGLVPAPDPDPDDNEPQPNPPAPDPGPGLGPGPDPDPDPEPDPEPDPDPRPDPEPSREPQPPPPPPPPPPSEEPEPTPSPTPAARTRALKVGEGQSNDTAVADKKNGWAILSTHGDEPGTQPDTSAEANRRLRVGLADTGYTNGEDTIILRCDAYVTAGSQRLTTDADRHLFTVELWALDNKGELDHVVEGTASQERHAYRLNPGESTASDPMSSLPYEAKASDGTDYTCATRYTSG